MQTTHQDTQATHPGRSLRRDLQQAPGFSARALLLAILGSAVGTVITAAFGSGQWGALAGAAIGPVISTTFSTKRTGETGRIRSATIILLSAGALLITVTGFTFVDQLAGKSVLPGPHQQPGTFLPLSNGPGTPSAVPSVTPSGSTAAAPGIQVQPDPFDCGTAAVGADTPCPQPVTITSTGTGALEIAGINVIGPDGLDFAASQDCAGKSLDPLDLTHRTCNVQISFQPTATGPRQATLVIHQNIPWPDQGTKITLTGVGDGGPGPSPTPSPSPSPTPSPSLSPSPSQPGLN